LLILLSIMFTLVAFGLVVLVPILTWARSHRLEREIKDLRARLATLEERERRARRQPNPPPQLTLLPPPQRLLRRTRRRTSPPHLQQPRHLKQPRPN
jgi:hypothetical protein